MFQKRNMVLPWNEQILDLYVKDYIFWGNHFFKGNNI